MIYGNTAKSSVLIVIVLLYIYIYIKLYTCCIYFNFLIQFLLLSLQRYDWRDYRPDSAVLIH